MLNVETAAFQKGCTHCSRMNAFRQGSHEDSKIKLALELVLVVVIIFCFCIPVGVSPPSSQLCSHPLYFSSTVSLLIQADLLRISVSHGVSSCQETRHLLFC